MVKFQALLTLLLNGSGQHHTVAALLHKKNTDSLDRRLGKTWSEFGCDSKEENSSPSQEVNPGCTTHSPSP